MTDAGEAARRIEKAFTAGGAYSGDDPVTVARAYLAQADEIERLRAAVGTAKREALEEAAQIVQRMDVAGLSIADMIRQRSRAIADIRALQEPK